ncbi:MAG TPA: hypothetical protein VGJ07_07675 [Rugosimonospora sp.]
MSDFDFDDRLIAGAVNDYQEATMNLIRPAGTAAAIATAKHRRAVRVASLAAVAAAVMIGAGTAYASLGPGEHAPPPVPGNQSSTSASPSATGSPSTSPSAAGTPSGSPTTGTGTHGPDNLNNATLNLPANAANPTACLHGPTKFSGGVAGQITRIEKVLAADVDADGSSDDVVLLDCRPGEGALRQVVAVHRAVDGTFTTLGVVQQISGQVKNVDDVKVNGSNVEVRVGDAATTYTDGSVSLGVFQWRTYGWNGTRFTQTGGSTSFVADQSANHLTTTVSSLVFGKPSGGRRTGTMTVTVRNSGSRTVKQVSLVMAMVDATPVTPSVTCPTDSLGTPTCQIGTLAAGASKTLTFTTSMSEDEAQYQIAQGGLQYPNADAQVRIGDQRYSDTKGLTIVFS